jgi:CO/xanthine dehydrogenase Mo-binding subunit
MFLKIDGSGAITVMIHRPDLGQGIRTAFAMIVADELGADWSSIRIQQATANSRFGNQVTGGSLGISQSFLPLRKAAVVARMVMISAASKIWNYPEEECRVENSAILHEATGQRLSFAEVVEVAASLPVPGTSSLKYKNSDEYNIIGTSVPPLDHPDMVTGQVDYTSDINQPDMLYAVLARCPVPSGRLVSFDATRAEAEEGVHSVIQVAGGVAILANSTWAAIKGRQVLDVTWDEGQFANLSTSSVRTSLTEKVVPAGWNGNSTDPGELSAVYEVPFFAHATMEPPYCIVHIHGDRCEVWAPTQVPAEAATKAATISGVSKSNVDLHIPLIGGGFGRRLEVDFIEEALKIAKTVDVPVKLIRTREDDIQHDYYHPFSVHFLTAQLDKPSLPKVRSSTYESIPTGPWRSVTNFTEAFVRESFIDEMAVAMGRDPLELRLEIEPKQLHQVLEKAAEESGWGSPLPEGWGRGIACHSTWDVTPVAQVAEVSVSETGEVTVHRVVCAVDPGLVIHPEMVKAQMEGGIVFGLTAALKESITFENGHVDQSNFHDFPILRMNEMPKIEVHLITSGEVPRGVGEMGVPPIAPAVLNAIFAATGVRVRHLPVRAEDLV